MLLLGASSFHPYRPSGGGGGYSKFGHGEVGVGFLGEFAPALVVAVAAAALAAAAPVLVAVLVETRVRRCRWCRRLGAPTSCEDGEVEEEEAGRGKFWGRNNRLAL